VSDVEIFAIGVGNDVNETELRNIASNPSQQFVYQLQNFPMLNQIIPYHLAIIHRRMYDKYCNQHVQIKVGLIFHALCDALINLKN